LQPTSGVTVDRTENERRRQYDEVIARHGNVWYLSDQSPWQHNKFFTLLLVLLVTSTFGLVLFAVSLQGFLISAGLDPFVYLLNVGICWGLTEFAEIITSVSDGLRAIREERKREREISQE
jgi:hypothetical protein